MVLGIVPWCNIKCLDSTIWQIAGVMSSAWGSWCCLGEIRTDLDYVSLRSSVRHREDCIWLQVVHWRRKLKSACIIQANTGWLSLQGEWLSHFHPARQASQHSLWPRLYSIGWCMASFGRPPQVSRLFASAAATFQCLCVCMHKLLTGGLFVHASRTLAAVEIGLSSLNISCAWTKLLHNSQAYLTLLKK